MEEFNDDIEIKFKVRSVSKHDNGVFGGLKVVQITMDLRLLICILSQSWWSKLLTDFFRM